MLVIKLLTVVTDVHLGKKNIITWKSMTTVNC